MRPQDQDASEQLQPGESGAPPQPAPAEPVREGNTGQGSDSIIRHLRQWEQRRAKDGPRTPSDKPGRNED
jgi:hypothetical protein